MKTGSTKIAGIFLAGALLLLSNNSFAEYFCISDEGKPRHCDAGDILLVKPTLVPRVCDFSAQILRMPTGENKAEYLCRYTGTVLAVKELKSRSQKAKVQAQSKAMRPPPKRNNNNKMFGNMPFFK